MKAFAADLHIHTPLSPCAMDDMTPAAIVSRAIEEGLDIIAVCDHNAAANVRAVQEKAGKTLAVLAGIEITTAEEAHILGLFPDAAIAAEVAAVIQDTLPFGDAASRKFGLQLVMDSEGNVIGSEEKMLSTASTFDLAAAVKLVREHGGLAIASHVDRPSFSVISQLGFFPPDVTFDAIEISAAGVTAGRDKQFESLGLPMLASSDSHSLFEIGAGRTGLLMRAPTFRELSLALKGENGRTSMILGASSFPHPDSFPSSTWERGA